MLTRTLLWSMLASSKLAAQQPTPPSACENLPGAAIPAPAVTATTRGEFLQAGKTLIQDVFLSSADGTPVRAFIIKPYKPAPGGGAAFFLHWLGGPPLNDRGEFFDDAMQLAERNVTSLLIDAPWADPAWFPGRTLDEDYVNTAKYGAQLQGYFRFLMAQATPDPEKVAFIGHDFGGMYGALLLQREKGIRHAVVMAAVGDFGDWFVLGRRFTGTDSLRYRQHVAELAPTRFLHCAGGPDVLFQFAEDDRFVSRAQAALLMESAPAGKQAIWYPGGHELQDASRKDRLQWLLERIGGKN